jgi:hypothetical protein
MAVIQNELAPDQDRGDIRMWMTLEKAFNPEETTLTQFRPRELWLELDAAPGGAGPVGLRWGDLFAYPAATWRIDAPEWPRLQNKAPMPATLNAWWSLDHEATAGVELQRDVVFNDPFQGLPGRVLRIDEDDVEIEGVDLEDHAVAARPDGGAEVQSFLVVRLRHAPGKPVYVRVAGIDPAPAHVEHRFYTSVGHTTSLFGPVTHDQVRDQLKSFSLVSVSAFKRETYTRQARLENLVPGGIPQRPPASIPLAP